MERATGVNKFLAAYKETISVTVIILFHLVGLLGLTRVSWHVSFIHLVPFHLLLMFAVILFAHEGRVGKLLLFVAVIYMLGFLAEWLGVHKSLLFGHYAYGKTLGWKVYDIPLIIGINWFLLIYAAGVLVQRSRSLNNWVRVITGAIILVCLDLLIEPVAMKFDYWQWMDNFIPNKNYLTWFVISAVMLFVFEKFHFKRQSNAAIVLLLAQFVFFAVLRFF